MGLLDFADFDKKFELKANEASEDLIAKKEQGIIIHFFIVCLTMSVDTSDVDQWMANTV